MDGGREWSGSHPAEATQRGCDFHLPSSPARQGHTLTTWALASDTARAAQSQTTSALDGPQNLPTPPLMWTLRRGLVSVGPRAQDGPAEVEYGGRALRFPVDRLEQAKRQMIDYLETAAQDEPEDQARGAVDTWAPPEEGEEEE